MAQRMLLLLNITSVIFINSDDSKTILSLRRHAKKFREAALLEGFIIIFASKINSH